MYSMYVGFEVGIEGFISPSPPPLFFKKNEGEREREGGRERGRG